MFESVQKMHRKTEKTFSGVKVMPNNQIQVFKDRLLKLAREAQENWKHSNRSGEYAAAAYSLGRTEALQEALNWAKILDNKANGTIS